MTIYSLTTFGTILICAAIIAIAIIRLRLCGGDRRARLKYTLIVSTAFTGMSQPVFIYLWPGATCLFLCAMLLIVLISGVPPLKAYKDTNDFFDTALYDPHIHGED